MSKVRFFKLLKIQSFEKLLLLSKMCVDSLHRVFDFCKRFSILEENYGADIIKEYLYRYVSFLLTNVQKPVVGWVILSCKSHILLSISAFSKKNVVPTSLMDDVKRITNKSFPWDKFWRNQRKPFLSKQKQKTWRYLKTFSRVAWRHSWQRSSLELE